MDGCEFERQPRSSSEAMTVGEWTRLVANAANLTTPLGLGIALLGRARVRSYERGLFLAEGYRLPFPVAGAFTVGNVIITAKDVATLQSRWPEILDHEEGHTWQYAWSLGLPFFPLYALSMGWSWLRTGDRAAANVFERAAGLERGGYPEVAKRPLREGLRELRGLIGTARRKTR